MLTNESLFGNGQNYSQGQGNCGFGYQGGFSAGYNTLGLNNQFDFGFNQLSQLGAECGWNTNSIQQNQQIQCNFPGQQFIQQQSQCLPQFMQSQQQQIAYNTQCEQPIQQQISFSQLPQQIIQQQNPCNIQQSLPQFIQTQPIVQQIGQQIPCQQQVPYQQQVIPQQVQCNVPFQQQLIPQQIGYNLSCQQSLPQFVSQPIQQQIPVNIQPQQAISQIISQPLIQSQLPCNYQQPIYSQQIQCQQQPLVQCQQQPLVQCQQQPLVQCQQQYPIQIAAQQQVSVPVCQSPPPQQIINHTPQDSIISLAPNAQIGCQTPLHQTGVFYRQPCQQIDPCQSIALQSGVYARPQQQC